MLILSKGVEKFGIGRFNLEANDFEHVLYITTKYGPPPSAQERSNLEKFIMAKRPDIMRKSGLQTGWGIQFPMALHSVRATRRAKV